MKTQWEKILITTLMALMIFVCSIPPQNVSAASRKYYSEKQLKLKRKVPTTTCVLKIKNGKIYYQDFDYYYDDDDNEHCIPLSKKKSAIITKKSKFYMGNVSKYLKSSKEGYSQNSDKNRSIKWLYRVNKKTFSKNALKKHRTSQLIVKNGKLIKAFTNMETYE